MPSGNPSEQPCQLLENPVLPSSFTQINKVAFTLSTLTRGLTYGCKMPRRLYKRCCPTASPWRPATSPSASTTTRYPATSWPRSWSGSSAREPSHSSTSSSLSDPALALSSPSCWRLCGSETRPPLPRITSLLGQAAVGGPTPAPCGGWSAGL